MPDVVTAECPVCGEESQETLLSLGGVPVHANVLWPTREDALGAPRADIELTFCGACGMMWNRAFDASRLDYGVEYENSLHFSPAFQRYADSLAGRLVERYDVRGKRVVEIGSGKGEFLASICALGSNEGIGFDPSYDGESDAPAGDRVRFVPELFTEETATGKIDLVVCRHVLEHLEDPLSTLVAVRRAAHPDTVVYLEVPSGDYLLREHAIWDVIYPHYSVFTARALRTAVERTGFDVLDSGVSFGGQYLWIEAGPAGHRHPPADRRDDRLLASAAEFRRAAAEKCDTWSEKLADGNAGRSAVWGAGAKGTMFLNLVGGGGDVRDVVDLNPRKHDTFIPGTGQRIVPPSGLVATRPERVLVMNPIYRDEIAGAVLRMGLAARIDVV